MGMLHFGAGIIGEYLNAHIQNNSEGSDLDLNGDR